MQKLLICFLVLASVAALIHADAGFEENGADTPIPNDIAQPKVQHHDDSEDNVEGEANEEPSEEYDSEEDYDEDEDENVLSEFDSAAYDSTENDHDDNEAEEPEAKAEEETVAQSEPAAVETTPEVGTVADSEPAPVKTKPDESSRRDECLHSIESIEVCDRCCHGIGEVGVLQLRSGSKLCRCWDPSS